MGETSYQLNSAGVLPAGLADAHSFVLYINILIYDMFIHDWKL